MENPFLCVTISQANGSAFQDGAIWRRDIGDRLAALGLSRDESTFRDNGVDLETASGLTADDLRELGVTSVGQRRKLLGAVAALSADGEIASVNVAQGGDRAERTPPAPDAERRYLTVMFVDLVGSTGLSARLDPEDLNGVIQTYQNAVAFAIARVEGHLAKFMGDCVLTYFGWARTHEGEPERAVRSGKAIVAAVGLLQEGGSSLACRFGIATGLVLVVGNQIGNGGEQEQAVIEDTPNLAARLQESAAPGQVVVAEATATWRCLCARSTATAGDKGHRRHHSGLLGFERTGVG